MKFLSLGFVCTASLIGVSAKSGCRFAKKYSCSDFFSDEKLNDYLDEVATWEGEFAKPGIGYDAASGYTYDGHPINYQTGELYGVPHLFSAPSKGKHN